MGMKKPDQWRELFRKNACDVLGEEKYRTVFPEEIDASGEYSEEENFTWTKEMIERLEKHASREDVKKILMRCAHQLPESRISILRAVFEWNGDIDDLHDFWQKDFIMNIERRFGKMPEEWRQKIIEQNWGEAGLKKGNLIIATKIPADLKGYFEAKSDIEKKASYCHCDRIREAIRSKIEIPSIYCYCGGGFYKTNWERILGRPVRIELLKSILKGDDVCQFAIHLPED